MRGGFASTTITALATAGALGLLVVACSTPYGVAENDEDRDGATTSINSTDGVLDAQKVPPPRRTHAPHVGRLPPPR